MSNSELPPNKTVLEKNRRLSESLLWTAQRRYYERHGTAAWAPGPVPTRITSNAGIAYAYAQTVVGFLRDCARTRPSNAPYYILELGAGTGRFAFQFLRALERLRAGTPLEEVSVRYIATDLAESNLRFLREHASLRAFIEAGALDLAHLDVERVPDSIALSESGLVLSRGDFAQPLVIIANYVFDSIPQDAFHFSNGQVFEHLVTLSGAPNTLELACPFDGLDVCYQKAPAQLPHYGDAGLDALLAEYARQLDDATILLPVAALRALAAFARLTGDRMLLLSGDMGSVEPSDIDAQTRLAPVIHGSLSLPVNYHAISTWFRQRGGIAFRTAYRQARLHVTAHALGMSDTLSETDYAYRVAFEGLSWSDAFHIQRSLSGLHSLSFQDAFSLLRMSLYDPDVLYECIPLLAGATTSLSSAERHDLGYALRRVRENDYPVGEQYDLPFELGTLLHLIGDHAGALDLFAESLRTRGENAATYWNMALCAFAAGNSALGARYLAETWRVSPRFRSSVGLLPKSAGT